jgi:hypothetical protein
VAKPQDNPSIGRWLNPHDATIFTYFNAQDEFLYHSNKGGKLEERAVMASVHKFPAVKTGRQGEFGAGS